MTAFAAGALLMGAFPQPGSACSPIPPRVQWSPEVAPGQPLIVSLQCFSSECSSDTGLHLEAADGSKVAGEVLRTAPLANGWMLAWQPEVALTEGAEYEVVFADPDVQTFDRPSELLHVAAQPGEATAPEELAWDVDSVERNAGAQACCLSGNYCDGRACFGEEGTTVYAALSPYQPGFLPYVLRRSDAAKADAWSVPDEAWFEIGEGDAGRVCVDLDVWDLRTDQTQKLEHCETADFEVGMHLEDWTLLSYCEHGPPMKTPDTCRDADGAPTLEATDCELSPSLTARWCETFAQDSQSTYLDDDGMAAYTRLCTEDGGLAAAPGARAGGPDTSGCGATGGTRSAWALLLLCWAWERRRAARAV